MKISFKNTGPAKDLTFGDVMENQFFVDNAGDLCQKVTDKIYNVVASSDGTLHADSYDGMYPNMPVTRILDHIDSIEF